MKVLLAILSLLVAGCTAMPTVPAPGPVGDGTKPCWVCKRADFKFVDTPSGLQPYCENWHYGPEPCIVPVLPNPVYLVVD